MSIESSGSTILQFSDNFCDNHDNIYYTRLKELGGGGILDIGIYCVQLASFIFEGEKPVKVISGGHLNPQGVDESSSTTIIYAGGKSATLVTHCRVNLPNEAIVVGTKGTLKVKISYSQVTFDDPVIL